MIIRILLLLASACAASGQTQYFLDLSGEWRRSADDRPDYSKPDFDDRDWANTSLPWTARPPYGIYWLRRPITIPDDSQLPARLALVLGPVGEAYQVYVNGSLIGETGNFSSIKTLQLARSRVFPLPSGIKPKSLAIRVLRLQGPPSLTLFKGGSYALTSETYSVSDEIQLQLFRQRELNSITLGTEVFLFCFAILIWLLWLSEPKKMELFWLGLMVAARGSFSFVFYGLISLNSYPWRDSAIIFQGEYFRWVKLNLAGELPHVISGIALAELILSVVRVRTLWIRLLFWAAWILCLILNLPLITFGLYDFPALAFLIWGWSRQTGSNRSGPGQLTWILLLLVTLTHLNTGLRAFPTNVEINGYYFNLTSFSIAILSMMLAFLSLRRLIADRQEKERLAGELEAARTVQQLLLPSDELRSQTFEVSSVYEPAQEVGGDFYWNRTADDGSLVVVVGDVSGKGLKAAMLVSVAIGVLRNERSHDPASILSSLNNSLVGHTGGGFVTVVVARFALSGVVTVASAGHPSPYCDGRELEVEAGLPLGIAAGVSYCEASVTGERFTFVSDGVVEAANAQGELFGFERTRKISTQPAGAIAEAAKAWGQNDDITVVTVRRKV